jgi:predicted YcjX-like family ATPase
MAIAAVRSTTNVRAPVDGIEMDCVQGLRPGGGRPTVLYPGTLPERRADLEDPDL